MPEARLRHDLTPEVRALEFGDDVIELRGEALQDRIALGELRAIGHGCRMRCALGQDQRAQRADVVRQRWPQSVGRGRHGSEEH